MTTINGRTPDHSVDPLFLERWSPRAFTGQPISDEHMMSLFEAARWAPSSFNSQPWRFLYARRDTPAWERFLGLLIEFNQLWAQHAALLIIATSATSTMQPGKDAPTPLHTHSYDTGAAWMSIALQATRLGLQAHGMAGFDRERAFVELNVPEGYRVEAAIAVGHPADKSVLPEKLQAREHPSDRNPIASFAFEGGFPVRSR